MENTMKTDPMNPSTVAEATDRLLDMRARLSSMAERNGNDLRTVRMIEACDRRLRAIQLSGNPNPTVSLVKFLTEEH
jgi:hypothetical protein